MGGSFETTDDAPSPSLQTLRVAALKDGIWQEALNLVEDLPGWKVLAVDEQSTAGMSAAAVSQLVRGAEGSVLRLSLRKCTDGCFAEVFLMRCVITSRYGESEDVVMVHLCAASERGLR